MTGAARLAALGTLRAFVRDVASMVTPVEDHRLRFVVARAVAMVGIAEDLVRTEERAQRRRAKKRAAAAKARRTATRRRGR